MRSRKKRKRFNIQRPYDMNVTYVEFKYKSNTNNNRDNWNHLKIIQKISGQNNWKVLHKKLQ